MGRLFSILLWTAVFLLIVLAVDQLLIRVPASLPAHVAVADFYRDLRGRLLELVKGGKPAPAPVVEATPAKPPAPKVATAAPGSVEAIIEQRAATPSVPDQAVAPAAARPGTAVAQATGSQPRYVYADSQGQLHFADTLNEVPADYRSKAKKLGE
jgi:hypothetical protein